MRMPKFIMILTLAFFVVAPFLEAQRKYVPPMSREERVNRFIRQVKRGDRKIFRFVTYYDLEKVVDKVIELATSNGRNFSDELTDDWKVDVRKRVISSTVEGLFNKDPRVRLVAINWLRRLRPDGSMMRHVKRALVVETTATEVEKRKVKDLDLHDSGFLHDPEALWKPGRAIFNSKYRAIAYCGRTFWDGGDLPDGEYDTRKPRTGEPSSYVAASREGGSSVSDRTKPSREVWSEWKTDRQYKTKMSGGKPDHSYTYEYDENKSIDMTEKWNYSQVNRTVAPSDDMTVDESSFEEKDRYVSKTAWLDQGRYNSERSNKVHPAYLEVRGNKPFAKIVGTPGYVYLKVRRIKNEEKKYKDYDDVWDELVKLDEFITRDVWTKKIKQGQCNALRIISKETFFTMARRIDGEDNAHIPFISEKIFTEKDADCLIVGLLENKVISTRYQCALTLSRVYKDRNTSKATRQKIRTALRLARKKLLLVDIDKGKEFSDWLEIDLDNRNKRIRAPHRRKHHSEEPPILEDDEIDTSIDSIEVPVTTEIFDWVGREVISVRQYNDYTRISSWDFDPMSTVSRKGMSTISGNTAAGAPRDVNTLANRKRAYVDLSIVDDYSEDVYPGDPHYFRPIDEPSKVEKSFLESKEYVLYETRSLRWNEYKFGGPIRHLNRFQGYVYKNVDEPEFTLRLFIDNMAKAGSKSSASEIASKQKKLRDSDRVVSVNSETALQINIKTAYVAPNFQGMRKAQANWQTDETTGGELQTENKYHSSIINYLGEIKKARQDYDDAKREKDEFTARATISATNYLSNLESYNRKLREAGEKINLAIAQIYETELKLFELKLRQDTRESFLYDVTYKEHLLDNTVDTANTVDERRWVMAVIKKRMRNLYRWRVELSKTAVERYIDMRILDVLNRISKPGSDDITGGNNLVDVSARARRVINLDRVIDSTSPMLPLPKYPEGDFATVGLGQKNLVDNYVNKPHNDVLVSSSTERNNYLNSIVKPQTEWVGASSLAPVQSYTGSFLAVDPESQSRICQVSFFDQAKRDWFNKIHGLNDEVERRNLWIEENKEKIYHYNFFINENKRAHRLIRALKNGERKVIRTADYTDLKNAMLIMMYRSGIVKYDVDLVTDQERYISVKIDDYRYAVPGAEFEARVTPSPAGEAGTTFILDGTEEQNVMMKIQRDATGLRSNVKFMDPFRRFRRTVYADQWLSIKSSAALDAVIDFEKKERYEKGNKLRLAYSVKGNANIYERTEGGQFVKYDMEANLVNASMPANAWGWTTLSGAGWGTGAEEISHEQFVDMYGDGRRENNAVFQTVNNYIGEATRSIQINPVVSNYDNEWNKVDNSKPAVIGSVTFLPKERQRPNMAWNGFNDDRGDNYIKEVDGISLHQNSINTPGEFSLRDNVFVTWLVDGPPLAMSGTLGKSEDKVVEALLGGLLNEDPRVRMTCIHLLRRIGPKANMKADVELSLQDETVEERREVYLLGEQKFSNYLDSYGRYQYKNVLMELQKLHAYILRTEMVDKIKREDNYKYLAELSKTLFRILTHQIDRESWWRVPLGIDPEPDARYLYESVVGHRSDAVGGGSRKKREIEFYPLSKENGELDREFKRYFKTIAGGIENYYYTNQLETAAWVVKMWDESILGARDSRKIDEPAVFGAAAGSGLVTGRFHFLLRPTISISGRNVLTSTSSTPTFTGGNRIAIPNSYRDAEPIYAGRAESNVGRLGLNLSTMGANARRLPALANEAWWLPRVIPAAVNFNIERGEFVLYEKDIKDEEIQLHRAVKKMMGDFRKAVRKGVERDIIIPNRRSKAVSDRAAVVIEDGHPESAVSGTGYVLRKNVPMNRDAWYVVHNIGGANVIRPGNGYANNNDRISSTYSPLLGSPGDDLPVSILGSKSVLGSPSAVLAEPRFYYGKENEARARAEGLFQAGIVAFEEGELGVWKNANVDRENDYRRTRESNLAKTPREIVVSLADFIQSYGEMDLKASFMGKAIGTKLKRFSRNEFEDLAKSVDLYVQKSANWDRMATDTNSIRASYVEGIGWYVSPGELSQKIKVNPTEKITVFFKVKESSDLIRKGAIQDDYVHRQISNMNLPSAFPATSADPDATHTFLVRSSLAR